MFKTRRYNKNSDQVEIWEYEWVKESGVSKKRFVRRVSIEDLTKDAKPLDLVPGEAVCWSFESTMGNIAVDSSSVLGEFDGDSGDDALLPCEIIRAGKFRNGKPRWYCRTHLVYWGVKADKINHKNDDEIKCGNADMRFSYIKNPLVVDIDEFDEIGIWCALPAALSSNDIESCQPLVHVHARYKAEANKVIDDNYPAIICKNPGKADLFGATEIDQIQITPPAIIDFFELLISNKFSDLGCVSCNKCGFPHLDLGKFAKEAHAKHFCANCGNDSTWTRPEIISNPLKVLHDHFKYGNEYEIVDKKLNIDDYKGEVDYEIWASTPAVVWTGARPQEQGIHVHLTELNGGKRIIDDTFGEVILNGNLLDREELLKNMLDFCVRN
ncbi:hypothetical protein [Marinobacter changyiensis]|uniref:hypothetical protein n=1 Tax=Marinobacter changyiensis TaxID=2604091 RepID=UPI0015D3C653|nr:hypothetical protein [Marinobacter changyiensis]